MEKVALSPREFAAATGLSLASVYHAIRDGEIPSARIGRRILIAVSTLERLLEAEGSR